MIRDAPEPVLKNNGYRCFMHKYMLRLFSFTYIYDDSITYSSISRSLRSRHVMGAAIRGAGSTERKLDVEPQD